MVLIENMAVDMRPKDRDTMRKILAKKRKARASSMGSKKREKFVDPKLELGPMEAQTKLGTLKATGATLEASINVLALLTTHPALIAHPSSSSIPNEEGLGSPSA